MEVKNCSQLAERIMVIFDVSYIKTTWRKQYPGHRSDCKHSFLSTHYIAASELLTHPTSPSYSEMDFTDSVSLARKFRLANQLYFKISLLAWMNAGCYDR